LAYYRSTAFENILATSGIDALLAQANGLLDTPGQLAQGAALLKELHANQSKWRKTETLCSWRRPYLLFQGLLTAANHSGDTKEGERIWGEKKSLLPELRRHGLEGLKFEAELRNRRSINLMDQFRFDEAIEMLRELVSERTRLVDSAVTEYGFTQEALDNFSDDSLAACLGSLGQSLAVSGGKGIDEALTCLFKAIALFKNQSDRERQWIYLGHLACEQPDSGLPLWERVSNALPELKMSELVSGHGNQYKLALQLKGLLVFAAPKNIAKSLEMFETAVESYSLEARQSHPFGLIHQAAAICAIRLQNELPSEKPSAWGDFANHQFNLASTHMATGGAILQLLSSASRLRQQIFRLSYIPSTAASKAYQQLASTICDFLALASKPPLDASWRTDELGRRSGHFVALDPGDSVPIAKRAEALLSGIRLNYW